MCVCVCMCVGGGGVGGGCVGVGVWMCVGVWVWVTQRDNWYARGGWKITPGSLLKEIWDLLAIDHLMLALFWSYVPNMK